MEEVVTAALAEEPIPAPVGQPLALPAGRTGAARPLAGGGWLRAVDGGKGAPPAPRPEEPPPEADDRQLTIWDFKPRHAKPLPPKGTQLSLFDDPSKSDDTEHKY